MRNGMKERIIGGAILVALAIIVVPMFVGGSGKKEGSGQAPSMTINEEQIDVPDDQQASNGDGNEGQQPQGDGAGSDVSQYSQLLPGSEGPQDINPDAQASVTQAQQGSNGNASPDSGEGSAAAAQSHQMEPSQPVHESSAQSQQQPATPPQRPAHREPAHSQQPAESQRSNSSSSSRNATASNSTASRSSTASNAQPKSSSQGSSAQRNSDSSMASSDPILAAANRYDSNGSRSSASGASASGRWSVQAGSFGNAANADNLVKRLKGLGFNAYQISRGANKVVLVGPYNSSGAGESARTQLQQKANINGFVVHSGGNAG